MISASFALAFLPMISPVCDTEMVLRYRLLGDRVAIIRRITAGDVEFKLAFDVGEHAAGAKAEQMRLKPAVAQLFFHQGEPLERLFRGADASGGLEADGHAGFFAVFANGADHDQADRENGVDALLTGGSLDEVGSG